MRAALIRHTSLSTPGRSQHFVSLSSGRGNDTSCRGAVQLSRATCPHWRRSTYIWCRLPAGQSGETWTEVGLHRRANQREGQREVAGPSPSLCSPGGRAWVVVTTTVLWHKALPHEELLHEKCQCEPLAPTRLVAVGRHTKYFAR